MDVLFYIFAATIVTAASLGIIAIWSRRSTWIRAAAVGVLALFIPLAYIQALGMLSKPKPMGFEWFDRNVNQAAVLSVSLKEGEAIYLWLRLEGSIEPRFYVLPWHQRLAEKLQETMEAAVRQRGIVVVDNPFTKPGLFEQGDMNVRILPPPSPPSKAPQFQPRIYNPRSKAI